ncbi:Dynein heavy chain 2, axonemal [Armadillidium vulgare]|nr:Dynein heavy chain 2, axonemal [Armadillidium vulgare]
MKRQCIIVAVRRALYYPLLPYSGGEAKCLSCDPDTILLNGVKRAERLKMELEEADSWNSLGFEVPSKISEIYADRKKYLNLISKVDSTVHKFNAIMNSISKDELRLFEIYIQLMVKSLYPALTNINWLMAEKITTICDKGITIANLTEKEVAEYLFENKKIQNKLYELSNLHFYVKSTSDLYVDSEFQDDILLQREKIMIDVKSSFTVIEDALSVLISCRSRPSNYLAPAFLLSVNLTNKSITCFPELEVIQETIYNLKDVFESSLSEVPCLLRNFSSVDDKVHLHNVELEDEFCEEMQIKLNNEFDVQTKKLKATLNEWSEYRNLWEVEVSDFFENYLYVEPDIQSFVNDIALLESKLKKLNECPDEINCGMFRLDFQLLIKSLKEKCHIWKDEFLIQFYKVSQYKLENLESFLENTQNMLKKVPSDLKGIFSMKEEVANCKKLLKQQSSEFDLISRMFRIISNYKFPVDERDEIRLTHLRNLNSQLENEINVHQICLSDKQENYRKHYIVKSEEIFQKTEEIKIFYKTNLPTKSEILPQDATSRIDALLKNIEEVRSCLDMNKELETLNLPPIHFEELDTYERHALHLREIWILFDEWHKAWNFWSKLLIWDINSVEFQELLLTFEKRLKDFLLSYLKPCDNQIPIEKLVKYEIEERLLRSIENCKELTPLIINFQSAKLESHHWNKIKEVVKADFDENSPSFSLQHFINLNFMFYQQEINMIIIEAAEEMRFMESLKKIETSANEIYVQTKYIPYVGSILIHSFNSTKEKIKEISIKIDVLSSSPYSAHYSSIIKSNKDLLKSMLSLLEILNDFQNIWVKWQTFFNTQDVREYFINLSTVFDLLTKVWNDISSMIANEIYFTKILKEHDPTKKLKEMYQELQFLFPLVEDYLFDKCLSYGRFCFLSLDDVIGALSKVYDGESARPYLKKMFMNIDKTKQLKNSNLNCMEIIGVYSEEGEFLELNPYVSVIGEFHTWCSNLEKSIESTLRNDVKQCRSALKSGGSKIDETLKVWPLQACIVAYMINFSLDVSKAFSKEGVPKKLLKKVSETALRIASVMKENVPKILLEKLRLFFLIVLQAKDMIDLLLDNPDSRNNFLYYHWEKETDNTTVSVKPYTFEYSWEYQGLWKTIVATPNYYQMVFNASTFLARGYNIGVIGEEGEGKSEMIKSFGYYLGRNVKSVITLNSLKLSSLFLLLLGAYQTHTWLVFEKAVKIPLSFLSTLEDLIIKPCQKNIEFTVNEVKFPNFEMDVEGITIKQNRLSAVIFELDNKSNSDSRRVLQTSSRNLKTHCFHSTTSF